MKKILLNNFAVNSIQIKMIFFPALQIITFYKLLNLNLLQIAKKLIYI